MMSDILSLAPELTLALSTMALMMVGAFGRGGSLRLVSGLSLLAWLVAVALVWRTGTDARVFGDMLVLDQFSAVTKTMLALGAMAALMIGVVGLKDTVMARFEYPVLMGFSLLGMFLMVSANDMLALYVGLELSSLCLYVLAAFNRNDARSSEAGLKYFVLGAISSGLLLFGISLIYGYTGSTQFDVIKVTLSATALPGPTPVIVVFGMVMMIAALTFKLAAVPFHMWTPDVYDGAPTPVTAYFALVPKLAALALLTRLLTGPFSALTSDWTPVITLLAIASMVVGAFAAIVQTSIKRLLAYSSIGNIGYALIGLAVATHFGLSAILIYMAIYMVTTAGMFGLLLVLRKNGTGITEIADLAGLSKTQPWAAYAIAVLMFSMSGIPPMAGFFGKLAIFQAAVASQAYVLAVLGVLTSVVAAWYYINIIRVMFFEEPGEGEVTIERCYAAMGVIALSLFLILAFVVMPGPLSEIAANATIHLLP